MFSKIYNIFSPCASSQEPTPVKTSSVSSEEISIIGTFYTKILGQKFHLVSDEVRLSLKILDAENFRYSLVVNNSSGIGFDTIQFTIASDLSFQIFTNQNNNHCLFWRKQKDFYMVELYNDPKILEEEDSFYELLGSMIASVDMMVSLKKARKDESRFESINNMGAVDDIGEVIDRNFGGGENGGGVMTAKIKKLTRNMEDLSVNEGKKSSNGINNSNIIGNSSSSSSSKHNPKLKQLENLYTHENIDIKSFYQDISYFEILTQLEGKGLRYSQSKDALQQTDNSNFHLLKILDIGEYKYILLIQSPTMILTFTPIDSMSSIIIDEKKKTLSFLAHDNYKGKNRSTGHLFYFTNAGPKELTKLKELVARCLYENKNKCAYQNLDEGTQNYIKAQGIYEEDIDDFDLKKDGGFNINTNVNNSICGSNNS